MNDSENYAMNWTPFNDNEHGYFPVEKKDLPRLEILFDNGETRMYHEEWPFADATHYRLTTITKAL